MSIIRMKNKMKLVANTHSCSVDPEVWLDYVEGEISGSYKNDLDLHRAHCEVCKHNLAEFRSLRKEVAGGLKVEAWPSDEFFKNLEAKIMAEVLPQANARHTATATTSHPTATVVWLKKFSIPAASAAALFLLITTALLRSPTFKATGGGQVTAQNHLEEQYMVQAAFHNPEIVSNSLVTSQDEEDLILDATAEKMAHMSDAEVRSMMAKLR